MGIEKSDYYWLRIKNDWDAFPSYYFSLDKNSYFGGREELVNRLSYWLSDGGGGSVLISGVRGIGKTAFVYHSIRNIYEHNNFLRFLLGLKDIIQRSDVLWYPLLPFKYLSLLLVSIIYHFDSMKKITVVPVNAATIDPARLFLLGKGEEDRKFYNETKGSQAYLFWQYTLLQQLIAALHFSKVRSWLLRRRIANLYHWSISEGIDTQSTEFKGLISIDPNLLENLVPYLLTASAISFVFVPTWVTGIILVILSALKISQSLSKSKLREVKIKSSNFDYLYSELNAILNETRRETFIFVVDELDKVEDCVDIPKAYHESDAKGDGFVDLFVRSFKNLITISSGRFVFITSEKYYLEWSKGKAEGHPENSTFFGWNVYIPQASVSDIVKHLNLICIDRSQHGRGMLEILAYALYLKTGGHYSEIIRRIGSYVKYKESGYWLFSRKEPYISFDIESFPELAKRARLGKILENVVQQRASQNVDRQEFEYYQAAVLHAVSTHILDKKGIVGDGTRLAFMNEFIQSQKGLIGDSLKESDRQIVVSQIHDLLTDINNLATGKSGNTLGWDIPTDDGAQVGFNMDLASVGQEIDDLPASRSELTILEERLADKAEKIAVEIQEWIDTFGGRLVYSEVEFISMLNSEYTDDYVASLALAKKVDLLAQDIKSLGRKETIDPRDIVKALEDLEKVHDLMMRRLLLLGKYFEMLLPGVKITYGDQFVVLEKGSKKVGLASRALTAAYSVLRVSANKTVIVSDNFDSNKFGKLLKFVVNNLEVKYLAGRLNDWNVTSADNLTIPEWKGVYLSVPFVNSHSNFRKLICKIEATGDYWRFGIALGANQEKLNPLDAGNYTLIHIFKDTDSTNIRWKRVWNGLIRKLLSQSELKLGRGEVIGSDATQPITFEVKRLTRVSNFVWLYINGHKIVKVKMPENDYGSLYLLAWGDGKDFAMRVSNINVETSVESVNDIS